MWTALLRFAAVAKRPTHLGVEFAINAHHLLNMVTERHALWLVLNAAVEAAKVAAQAPTVIELLYPKFVMSALGTVG